MSFLNIDHVTKVFPLLDSKINQGETFVVFQDVDLKIKEGEFVTMIGHSGCGKSTLLNIIAGFDSATEGGIVLDDKEISKPGLDRMVVFQNFALMPWISTFENVRIAVRSAHPDWSKTKVRDWTQKYIDMMSLKGAERKKPAFLSGGMRQRVGLARAFAVEPKVLLLDEPYEGLAPVIVQEIEKTLEQIKALGMTTIIVEQNAIAALHLADRAIILDMGQVVFDGKSQAVLDDADLRQQYLAI